MSELTGAATPRGEAPADAAPRNPGAREDGHTRRARVAGAIQSSAAVIVLVIVTVLGAVAFGPRFASVNNLLNIVEDSSFLALLAIGMTFVILGEGIDLSVIPLVSSERHDRFTRNLEFDVCELQMGVFLGWMARGAPFTAIPVFPHRKFCHGNVVVGAKSGIERPEDLTGKTIGMQAHFILAPALV